jgi:hypothetical protein
MDAFLRRRAAKPNLLDSFISRRRIPSSDLFVAVDQQALAHLNTTARKSAFGCVPSTGRVYTCAFSVQSSNTLFSSSPRSFDHHHCLDHLHLFDDTLS